MVKQVTEIMAGIIVDETTVYSLQEVSYSCGVSIEVIEDMIAHGLIEPKKTTHEQQFDSNAVRRMKIALRLQKDLGVNLPGAALALDLLHELQELRNKINLLERQQLD
jgi:chaperone modulatory protein CbpM